MKPLNSWHHPKQLRATLWTTSLVFSLILGTSRAGNIECGQTTNSAITNLAQIDTYTFPGNAGEGLVVSVSGQPGAYAYFNAVADVYGPTGTRIGGCTNGATGLLGLARGTGPYKVLVHADDYLHAGAYGLSLSFVRLVPASYWLAIGTTNRAAALTLWGELGSGITIQCATNLVGTVVWSPLTNFSLPWSPYPFVDWSSTNMHQRFYRFEQSP